MKGYVAEIAIALAMIAGMTTAGAVDSCPQVRVFCPDDVTEGTTLSFRASVTDGDPNVVPTYNWTVSSGSIMSGQGTSTIQVDTTGLGNRTVTATVDIGGFDRICATTSSCSTLPALKVAATKVGEYPDSSEKASDPRLDGLARELEMDPSAQAYIIAYGGRVAREGEAQKALAAAKSYLVSKRGIDEGRIVTLNGGFKENFAVELWVVPETADPPMPSPTVDPSEVRPPVAPVKPSPKASPKRRRKN